MIDRRCKVCEVPLEGEQKSFCSDYCRHTWFQNSRIRLRKLDSHWVYDYSDYDPEDAKYGDG
jgi:predicted nucleic acid-binding Zn ribbon protein